MNGTDHEWVMLVKIEVGSRGNSDLTWSQRQQDMMIHVPISIIPVLESKTRLGRRDSLLLLIAFALYEVPIIIILLIPIATREKTGNRKFFLKRRTGSRGREKERGSPHVIYPSFRWEETTRMWTAWLMSPVQKQSRIRVSKKLSPSKNDLLGPQ